MSRVADGHGMELEAYWGVGPKTRAALEETIGTEAAVEAIDAGDVRALVDAGVDRSRATRILRHARSADGMELLATRDTRSVYKDILAAASEYAVCEAAADRIRTLTPLVDREEMQRRLDAVDQGRTGWTEMDNATRDAVLRPEADHVERARDEPDRHRERGGDDPEYPDVRFHCRNGLSRVAASRKTPRDMRLRQIRTAGRACRKRAVKCRRGSAVSPAHASQGWPRTD